MTVYSKVTRNGQITLPANVRRHMGIEEGDLIKIEVIDDKAVLVPQKLVDKNQAYFWSEKWQENEKKADEDIKSGYIKTFDSADELFRNLK